MNAVLLARRSVRIHRARQREAALSRAAAGRQDRATGLTHGLAAHGGVERRDQWFRRSGADGHPVFYGADPGRRPGGAFGDVALEPGADPKRGGAVSRQAMASGNPDIDMTSAPSHR